MSIETYSARRHYLTSLTAKMGDGHTVAKRIAVIRSLIAERRRETSGAGYGKARVQ
jgi:hypothetical protein